MADTVQTDAEKARTEIQKLSDFLRHQLYELPKLEVREIAISTDIRDSKATRLLIGEEYRRIRISLVPVLFLLITANVFFIGQGMESMVHRLMACLVMFGILMVLYAGIRMLFLHALKYTQSLRMFLIYSSIISLIVSSPVIAVYVIDSENSEALHIIITSLSILLNLGIFIVGTGGLMYIQQWLRNCKRMHILRFMVLQEEYYYLRKQINPHFLFNILNNADLSSYTDSDFSVRILVELRNVLLCQFDDADRMDISLGKEIDRIKSYLSLESFRLDNFRFQISADSELENTNVPSLIFMTFIENAVKYSKESSENRFVNISLRKDSKDNIHFECENNYTPGRSAHEDRGLGLSNTIRRLEILYGNRFNLNTIPGTKTFKIELTLPPYVEMYNCR